MAKSYAADNAVRVDGLDELRRALKEMDAASLKALGELNKKAADIIATDARGRAESLGGVARKTSPSIKASGATTAASVNIGGSAFPFALGAEFGAKKYPQFKPWRGNQWVESGNEGVGYFLHPSIRDDMPKVEEVYLSGIDDLTKLAFPD